MFCDLIKWLGHKNALSVQFCTEGIESAVWVRVAPDPKLPPMATQPESHRPKGWVAQSPPSQTVTYRSPSCLKV